MSTIEQIQKLPTIESYYLSNPEKDDKYPFLAQQLNTRITDEDDTIKDITHLLDRDKLKNYQRRLLQRSVRLYAAAARVQLPREAVKDWIEGDVIDAETIKQLLHPFTETMDPIDIKVAETTGDAAATGVPPNPVDIEKHVKAKIKLAKQKANISEDEATQLQQLLQQHLNVLRTDIGDDPPMKVDPFEIRVQDGAKPFRAKSRGYSQAAYDILYKTIKDLEEKGLIYANKNSRWAAPVMLIPKPGKPGEFRVVVDLRYINHVTIPINWTMPDIDTVIQQTKGSKFYAVYDLTNGFWQCPVAKDSQEYYSFVTPWGVYTPTRMPQGAVDSGFYFQANVQELLKDLIAENKCILWIDDILIHAKTWEEFMDTTNRLLTICKDNQMKVAIHKSIVCDKEAHWCGRTITESGIKFHPRNYESLTNMCTPKTAGELCQFVAAITWMIKGIPRLAELKDSLSQLLEKIYSDVGSRKKRKIESYDLHTHDVWKAEHELAFQQCKQAIKLTMENTHWIPGATLCLFTDASDRFYAGLLTQVIDYDTTKPITEQIHMPMCTLSGKFTNSQVGWSTFEKEAYPIVKACQDWEYYLLTPNGFRVYTDHANIVTLFNPLAANPSLNKSSLDKVHRWLHLLSHFKIEWMEHLKGQDNVWADLLSRWAHKEYHEPINTIPIRRLSKSKSKALKNKKFADIMKNRYHKDFHIPDINAIKMCQDAHLDEFDQTFVDGTHCDKRITTTKEGVIHYDNKIWIPSNDTEMQQRLLVTAHCGPSGHRSMLDALSKLQEHFYWKELKEDVENFCHSCLMCEKTRDGATIPIPWGQTTFANKRLSILRMDFMFIEAPKEYSIHGFKYILVLKDEYSGFVELIPCKACDHQPVAEAIAWWCARYGVPDCIRSDQGSHFKNKVIQTLADSYGITFKFTLPYCPWSNGAVEIVNKTIKRVLTTAILEQNLATDDWPYLLPMVMNIINGSISTRLNKYSPREVFMGLPKYDPFKAIYNPRLKDKISNLKPTSKEFQEHMEDLITDLNEMHLEVTEAKLKRRSEQDKSFRKKHGFTDENDEILIPDIDFRVGDYVLVAIPTAKQHAKLNAIWRGPYKVTKLVHTALNEEGENIDNRIFEVEHLVTHVKMEAHAMRIKFYNDESLDTKTNLNELSNHISAQEARILELEDITNHKYDNELMTYVVYCKWRGFTEDENSWEPLHDVYTDAKLMIERYLSKLSKPVQNKLRDDIKAHLNTRT